MTTGRNLESVGFPQRAHTSAGADSGRLLLLFYNNRTKAITNQGTLKICFVGTSGRWFGGAGKPLCRPQVLSNNVLSF